MSKKSSNTSKIKINGKVYASSEQFAKLGRGCATLRPNQYQIERNDERLRSSRIDPRSIGQIQIDVQFIHLTNGPIGRINESQRVKQIEVLNKAYLPAGIKFLYKPEVVKECNNPAWFKMDKDSAEERQAKSALRASPERHLNFYTAGLRAGLLGWATFPWKLEGDRDLDGVVILHSTLPDGTSAPFNLGMTAVHEIGHWLGLYHTFQGGCDAVGDHVGDTISHSTADYGTPADNSRNSACNLNEMSPVHNYMNYTDDAWMSEFTPGQIDRIKMHVSEYRSGFIT